MKRSYVLLLLLLTFLLPAPQTAFAQDEGLAYNVPILVSDGESDFELRIGIDPDASDGRDPMDQVLPPPPPARAFDARIRGENNDYQIEIRALTEETVEFEVAYAPTEGEGPIVLSWDPDALAAIGNFVIVDAFTGEEFTLDMTTDEDGLFDTSESIYLENNLVIRATAIPSSTSALLSGSVTYYADGGDAGIPLEGVELTLDGDASASVVTAADGTYTIEAETGGSYTLSAAKPDDAPPTRGVSGLDLTPIRRHIVNLESLDSPYKIIAADVNESGSVTGLDLTPIRRLIVNLNSDFGDRGLWQCVVAGQMFDDPQNPFPFETARSYTSLDGNQSSQDFHCFRRGDINGSWTPVE